MNNSETIIQHIKSGTPKNGWAVFKFKSTSTLVAIAWQLVAIALFSGAAYMFILMPVSTVRTLENYYLGYTCVLFDLLFFVGFIYALKRLLTAKSNFLVITDSEVLVSLCGKVREYPLKNISRLTLVQLRNSGVSARYRIEFIDTRTNRITDIAEKRYFGDESIIFNTLMSSLS